MSEARISREDGTTKGRYVATVPGIEAEAELTYSRVNEKLIIADHTGVPDVFRGRGLGRALVQRLVDDARAQGVKVIPLCPYVKAELARHPEWKDVLQT